LSLVLTHEHHCHDHTSCNHGGQSPEDNATPFNANPKPVLAVAATLGLASHNRQHESFPEFSTTPGDVIRLTARALHCQE
jgi:hypothetical protein